VQVWKNNCNTAEDSTLSFLLLCWFPFRLRSTRPPPAQSHPQNLCAAGRSVSLVCWHCPHSDFPPSSATAHTRVLAGGAWGWAGSRPARSRCWAFALPSNPVPPPRRSPRPARCSWGAARSPSPDARTPTLAAPLPAGTVPAQQGPVCTRLLLVFLFFSHQEGPWWTIAS